MRHLTLLLLATALPAVAQSVTTEPIGFNKVTCLMNSDTIVGVPLRKEGSLTTKLAAAPSGDTLTVTASLTAGQLTKHFAKFIGGTKDGYWFDITANTTNSITIDPNGDSLSGVSAGDSLLIAEYWTLDALFPPDIATTDAATTPHAIVRSAGALTRATEILLPNYSGQGINLSTAGTYYTTGITGGTSTGIWKKVGSSSTTEGTTVLYPDSYFIIRHNGSVTANTTFKSTGEVETGKLAIPLTTRTTGKQDNYVAVPRPLPVSLQDLNLDTTAFRTSSSSLSRTDELLVFDLPATGTTGKNRSASATYYRVLNEAVPEWRKVGGGSTNHNPTTIPAGAGFIIRKATSDGTTVFWNNPPSWPVN